MPSAPDPRVSDPTAGSDRNRRLFFWLVGVEIVLCLIHAGIHLTWAGRQLVSGELLHWTHIQWDAGPSQLLTVATMMMIGIAGIHLFQRRPKKERRGWLFVGLLFTYLAFDDFLRLHEAINDWAHQWVGDRYVYTWIVVLLPIFAVCGMFAFWFLANTLGGDKRRFREMILGFACLGAAVGLEVLERKLQDVPWRLRGFNPIEYTWLIEEFLELLGPALLLLCFGRIRDYGLATDPHRQPSTTPTEPATAGVAQPPPRPPQRARAR